MPASLGRQTRKAVSVSGEMRNLLLLFEFLTRSAAARRGSLKVHQNDVKSLESLPSNSLPSGHLWQTTRRVARKPVQHERYNAYTMCAYEQYHRPVRLVWSRNKTQACRCWCQQELMMSSVASIAGSSHLPPLYTCRVGHFVALCAI